MNIYTIGFTQKNAETFFRLLIENNVECLVDVRLNNVSQLAGFTKANDLKYFLEKIANIKYIHNVNYAPTKDILDNYKKNKLSWCEYEQLYMNLIKKRNVERIFTKETQSYSNVCFLCSEPTAQYCHRRLLAEYLKNNIKNISIRNL